MSAQTSIDSMNVDHAKWHSQHELWSREIGEWHDLCRSVLTALSTLEGKLKDHCEAIELHRESIEQIKSDLEQHMHLMAADEERFSELQHEFSGIHMQEAKNFERQCGVHERLGNRQRQLMTRLAEFAKFLNSL